MPSSSLSDDSELEDDKDVIDGASKLNTVLSDETEEVSEESDSESVSDVIADK